MKPYPKTPPAEWTDDELARVVGHHMAYKKAFAKPAGRYCLTEDNEYGISAEMRSAELLVKNDRNQAAEIVETLVKAYRDYSAAEELRKRMEAEDEAAKRAQADRDRAKAYLNGDAPSIAADEKREWETKLAELRKLDADRQAGRSPIPAKRAKPERPANEEENW